MKANGEGRVCYTKISYAVANIVKGQQQKVELGNLDAKRDWGHAEDYVRAMWMMLQQDTPDDYVIASGETHKVREFAELAFKIAGIELEWEGEGVNEKAYDKKCGSVRVEINPEFFRPAEVDILLGDPSKAEQKLGWRRNVSFEELVRRMVESDIKSLE